MTSLAKKPPFQRVLIRADGSSSIGLGHVVRSFVLARELHDLGVEVEVWGSSVAEGKALADSFQPVHSRDLPEPLGRAGEIEEVLFFNPDLVIADGYHFEKQFFEALGKKEIPYGVIDDNGETQATRPLFVVNQNPSADRMIYEHRFPRAELFLGLKFALLRKEILHQAESGAVPERQVLVSLGGSDTAGLTLPITTTLARANLKSLVVLGPTVENRPRVLAHLKRLPGVKTGDASTLLNHLASCDVAVLASGSTLWEANALRATVLAVVIAQNQIMPVQAAATRGLVNSVIDATNPTSRKSELGRLPILVEKARRSIKAPSSVPFDGATRLSSAIRDIVLNLP